jgi:hypothetical protein
MSGWTPAPYEPVTGARLGAVRRDPAVSRYAAAVSDRQADGPTPAQQAAFRRGAAKALALAVLGLVVTALGQQLPDRLSAAIFAVLSALLLAVVIGLLVAVVFVGSYHEDRAALATGATSVLGYVRRAGAWGLAAAGVGALLAGALPTRLAAGPDDPAALPTTGLVAIAFGGFGVAYGALEEWRDRVDRHAARDAD